jgi:hypothetical protein
MRRALAAAALLVALGGDALRRVTAPPVTPWKASVPGAPRMLIRVDPPCRALDLGGWTEASLALHSNPPLFGPGIGASLSLRSDGTLRAAGLGDYHAPERACVDATSARRFVGELRALAAAPAARRESGDSPEWYFTLALVGADGSAQTSYHHDWPRVEPIVAAFLRANPSPASRVLARRDPSDLRHRASILATANSLTHNPHEVGSVRGEVHEDGWFVLQRERETVSGRFAPSAARDFVKWLHLSGHPELDIQDDCASSPTDPPRGLGVDLAWDEATGLGVTSFVERWSSPGCPTSWGSANAAELE